MGLKIYSSTFRIVDGVTNGIGNAFSGISTDSVCGVVCCGVSDTADYHQLLSEIKISIYTLLGKKVPVTLIPQPLLPEGGLAVEVYALEGEVNLQIEEQEGVCYGIIESDEEKMLFVEGIPANDFTQKVSEQSKEVFAKLDTLLSKHGFEVDDIVRQWNYIGNIVACKDGKQNYQEFNDARSRYYGKGEWRNGYPAATGIGSTDGIIVGGIAFKKANGSGVYPIDNPLQVAAHIYSKNVLIDGDENAIKSTPKFERAKLIESAGGTCCFVSGTAAIRGEESVDPTSAKLQTIKTIENIEYLVSKENLVRFGCKPYELKYAFLHIFVKNREDYADIRSVVEESYPQVPALYSIADVCRSELLVEIEGILTL
jgi:enamine deaminase RidA (YjgF/YER057c/UK114 family)